MPEDELPAVETPKAEFIDPNDIEVVFADWIVAAGIFENVINLDLGTVDYSLRQSETDSVRIRVIAKLRFSRQFAERLKTWLETNLTAPPPDEEGQSDTPPRPPPNATIN